VDDAGRRLAWGEHDNGNNSLDRQMGMGKEKYYEYFSDKALANGG
jgi:hypothetical protein